MKQHKILKLLALTGALLGNTLKAEEKAYPQPGITILAATEQDGAKRNNTEVTLKPDLTYQMGDYTTGYYGSFYRAKETPGNKTEWMTFVSKIRTENPDWAFEIGRSGTREYPGYIYAPTTTSFDNRGMTKGTGRTFTGMILTHKKTGLSLGQVAGDTRMTPTHWDSTLLGWAKELDNEWAIQLQTTGGRRPLSTLGVTLKYQPTRTTTVVAEAFYWNKDVTGILTANHKLMANLNLFAGIQMTAPYRGKPEGLTTTGIAYGIGQGLSICLAVQHALGTHQRTVALLGIKYAGNFR